MAQAPVLVGLAPGGKGAFRFQKHRTKFLLLMLTKTAENGQFIGPVVQILESLCCPE